MSKVGIESWCEIANERFQQIGEELQNLTDIVTVLRNENQSLRHDVRKLQRALRHENET